MQDEVTLRILTEVAECIPRKTKVFLVGGAIRNAVYYDYFGKKLPARDYDICVIGSPKVFIANLRKRGFSFGKLKRKHQRTLKKKKIPKPKGFKDLVVLDLHFSSEKNILENLRSEANFTINGFALPFEKIVLSNWMEYVISIKGAESDLKNRILRANSFYHPAQIYACIRFIAAGFKPPSKSDVKKMLLLLGGLRKSQLKRNLKKVFEQTGGKAGAVRIARRMGIKEDIFSFETIKKIRKKKIVF